MAAFIENAPEQVLAAAKELLEKGLVEGTSGNISARMEDGNVACTPSSLDYRVMTLEDIVIVDPDGETVSGTQSPTSEKYLHLACLDAYEDIAVVIHSHAVYATMFAVAHQDIPSCIDEFTVYLGGDIRCTEYAASGSPDLGRAGGQGPGGPGRRADRQPRHGGGGHHHAQGHAQHGPGRAQRQDHLGIQATRRHPSVAREDQRPIRRRLPLHAIGGPPVSEGRIAARLAELGLTLHGPHPPHDPLDAVVIHDGVARTSGQLPRIDGKLTCLGRLGDDVTVEQGREAAAVCALNALAVLEAALGSLDRIRRVLSVTGFVSSAPDFHEQPAVIDGASKVLADVFGEAGRHTRSAVGVAALPRDGAVEIEVTVALGD